MRWGVCWRAWRTQRNLHHGGTEDTEKKNQTAGDAEDAEAGQELDATGLRSRPGWQAERIRNASQVDTLWFAFLILSACHRRFAASRRVVSPLCPPFLRGGELSQRPLRPQRLLFPWHRLRL